MIRRPKRTLDLKGPASAPISLTTDTHLPHYTEPRSLAWVKTPRQRRAQEGRVVVRVLVSAAGDAAAVSVHRSSGYRMLDEAAVKAIKTWCFAPAKRAGFSVAGSVDVPVSFKLTD